MCRFHHQQSATVSSIKVDLPTNQYEKSFLHRAWWNKDFNGREGTRIGPLKFGVKFFFQMKAIFSFKVRTLSLSASHLTSLRTFFEMLNIPTRKCIRCASVLILVPFEGVMSSKVYLPILHRRVRRELERIGQNAVFQQLSAPCHKAKDLTRFFEENQIELLEWPGNSPDLNLTENIWAIVN